MKRDLQNDRRTQKTKKYLAEALVALIMEKGYDSITIQDIIDRANVGRSTFYSHYESKEQLLVGNVNFQQALIEIPFNDPENYPFGINISYLFHHTKEHLELAKVMARTKGIQILSDHFADVCAAQIYEHLKNNPTHTLDKITRYKAEGAAGGIIRILFKWLADDAKTPTNEMIKLANHILESCINELEGS